MTKVLLTPEMNIDFIIYNLMLAKAQDFDIPELLEEVRIYDDTMTEQMLRRKIDDLIVKQGIVRQKVVGYCLAREMVGRREIR